MFLKKFIFDISLEKEILPDDLQIVRVTPVFKGGDHSDYGYLTHISVFPCFSKILERITFNCFPKYLQVSKIFNPKSMVFQVDHSTDQSTLLFNLSSNILNFCY